MARYAMFATATVTFGDVAGAQTAPSLEADNLVLSRPRPGLDAEGLPLGGFRVFPRLDTSLSYDDNIYDTQSDKIGSAVVSIDPQVSVRSNWSRHALNLDAQGTIERYTNRATENNERYRIVGSGRIDLPRSSRIDVEAHALQSIEARGTPGDIFTAAGGPIQYHDLGGSVGASVPLGRLDFTGGGQFSRITYDDVRIGGVEMPQSYRDRRHYAASAGLAYTVSPALQPFVQVTFDRERYDLRDRDTSFDSKGKTLLGGVNISLTKLLTGRIGLGYRWRDYRNPSYQSSNGFTYDLALVWNPRTLVSVTLEAIKAIDESPSATSSGIVRNQGSVTIDYELLRNLILQVSGTEVVESFRGIDRTDHRSTASFGGRYLVNRFAELGLRYDYTHQGGASLFARRYASNNLSLVLTLQR